ncbi:cation diffusion facilitator family transporter [Bacillus sp. 03113]|uniref:cation diffusion facilitator family transporter n=1 Tax=Bacillus sp. 03113 TaxID=2578211 RepID=UPI00114151C0|nr:cation diffusion facilitator family transporter [Bacillus sp. 03113]
MESYNDIKQGEKGAWISIFTYILLSLLKIIVGRYTNSEALFSDGLNNTSDIVASLAVLIGLKISRRPPDKNHPYGHFRAETISALIASFIMAFIGVEVIRNAIVSFVKGSNGTPDITAAWVALISACVMFVVFFYNSRLAKRINNQALMAAAKDNLSDAYVSIGAFIGIIGSQFGYPWLDAITAIIVGLIICKTALEIFRDTANVLTDGFNEEEYLLEYKEAIINTSGVKEVKDIRARRHGNHVLLDVVIEVNPQLSVKESHDITEKIEIKMKKKFKIYHTLIHIEPVNQIVK